MNPRPVRLHPDAPAPRDLFDHLHPHPVTPQETDMTLDPTTPPAYACHGCDWTGHRAHDAIVHGAVGHPTYLVPTDTTPAPRTHVLRLGYGTSRGHDTYGYPIVRLTDDTTGTRVRCMGGGYDMHGTVVADWAAREYPDRLALLAPRAHYVSPVPADGHPGNTDRDRLYGVYARYAEDGTLEAVSMDGACGLETVWRALAAVGITVTERHYTRTGPSRGNTTGWVVTAGPVPVELAGGARTTAGRDLDRFEGLR